MITDKLKKGMLLLAEPSILTDTSFNRAVILLADYNDEGSVGFILNKPLKHSLNDLIPEINSNFVIYNGGPVEQDNLYFIHTVPELITGSLEISNGIYWGGNFELTKNLINQDKIDKNCIRFFLGYTGWGVNQLEKELEINTWVITNNNLRTNLLKKASSKFWKEKIAELGGDYLIWSNAPENPILN